MSDGLSSVLGDMDPGKFLAEHWQRKPLLVRSAIPEYVSPISGDELAGLAMESEVESRIVLENWKDKPWVLRHGPFAESEFEELPASHWTLLVQAIDLWVPETQALLDRFDFLPRWRLDDLMVSFAPAGGSVGPHFDQYDVFLLQVEGHRHWRLGGSCDSNTPLLAGTDLGILQEFTSHEDWLLGPGDMLYVPPNVAHWGIAESDCLTFSIGFRSPRFSDMLGDLAVELAAGETALEHEYYRDPPLTPAMAAEAIDPAFVSKARQTLVDLIDNEALIADWLARYMTQPKYPDLVEMTGERRRARINGRDYENGEPDQ